VRDRPTPGDGIALTNVDVRRLVDQYPDRTPSQRKAILGGNATRLLKLTSP
jgi:hypothetical protein